MPRHSRRLLRIASLFSVLLGAGLAFAAEPHDPWPGLVQDIFGNRPMRDGAGVIAIEMPARAEDAAKSRLGKMRYRQFARSGEGVREAQIMIGHPNNSGLQMNQVTQLYIPAFFVNELRLWQDDSLVLAVVDGGISLSEDPNVRF